MIGRRKATQLLALGAGISITACASSKELVKRPISRIIKPKRLQKGDTIGLISPGSSLSDDALSKSIDQLTNYGFKIKTGPGWGEQYGYLAGTDQVRLDDLHMMYRDPAVDAIWCGRGGYGCTRLLPMLDYQLIGKNPKVLMGYSDITALLNAINQRTGIVGFHGPVGSSDFNEFTIAGFENILLTPSSNYRLENTKEADIQTLIAGKARGIVVGGNLTLLNAMCGTDYQVDMKDKIVILEDVGEKPYKIDRMLTQLKQASGLSQAAGIVLGTFNDCESDEGDRSLTLAECLIDRLGDLNVPVLKGLSFGHISEQMTLPIGIMATLDASKGTLTYEEMAVQ